MKPFLDIVRDLRAHGLLEPAKTIADANHVTIENMLGRRRHHPISAARHELWSLAYDRLPSYKLLGNIFDRDHSTILAGVRTHRDRVAEREAVEPEQRP